MLSGGDRFRMCGLRPAFADCLQIRDARLRAHERAAHVDAEHQVEALHRRLERARQRDRARVVDQDVDAAEMLGAVFFAASATAFSSRMSTCIGSALPPAASISRRRGVDRAGQLRMRLIALRGDRDVGAVARGAQCDREADAARRAGDEQGLAS